MSAIETDERVLIKAELAEVQRQIDVCDEETAANYGRRLALVERGRALDPPMTVAEMAAAAGVNPDALRQALNKARRSA